MANGDLNPDEMLDMKSKVSPGFFHATETALKNYGKDPEGTPYSRMTAGITLQKQFVAILGEDSEKKTKSLMKFRSDVMASQMKLEPDTFNKLLSYSDPNFVAKIKPEKVGLIQAGIDFIKNHYQDFVKGGNPVDAIKNFIATSTDPSVNPADITAHAQAAVKGDTLKAHPELVGHNDLSHNVVRPSGISQVMSPTATTKLKGTQKIAPPSQFKPGDERKKGDVIYVRQQDGTWLPKPKH
jgi:hypothetical protein